MLKAFLLDTRGKFSLKFHRDVLAALRRGTLRVVFISTERLLILQFAAPRSVRLLLWFASCVSFFWEPGCDVSAQLCSFETIQDAAFCPCAFYTNYVFGTR